jgi:REP element-mobilizing transposase RayT
MNSEHHELGRKSIRLPEFDYSTPGAYFITICARERELLFEQFPRLLEIVMEQWSCIPHRFPRVDLDAFVVMPNHIHGILLVKEIAVGATLAVAQDSGTVVANSSSSVGGNRATLAVAQDSGTVVANSSSSVGGNRATARVAPTIGAIVGAFKSLSVQHWLRHIKANGIETVSAFWQRNYYEHIIRNEDELNRCREYIIGNPIRWHLDRENPGASDVNTFEATIFERST